jgi:CHAT domain
MNGILERLWDFVVKPILDELGFTQPRRDGTWSRVWWVGSGLLSILPIHASGYHDDATSLQTVLDHVISSYTPTVKSLAYARERMARTSQVTSKEKALLLAMPDALPYVNTEIDDLKKLLAKASVDTIVMQNPTKMEVLL